MAKSRADFAKSKRVTARNYRKTKSFARKHHTAIATTGTVLAIGGAAAIKNPHKRNAYIAGVAVGAVGGYYTRDRVVNVRLYHNTMNKNLKSIKRNGFIGVTKGSESAVKYGERMGDVFFAKGRNTTKMYGPGTVVVKMNRKAFKKYGSRDFNTIQKNAFKIDKSHLKGAKISVHRGYARRYAIAAYGMRNSPNLDRNVAYKIGRQLKVTRQRDWINYRVR